MEPWVVSLVLSLPQEELPQGNLEPLVPVPELVHLVRLELVLELVHLALLELVLVHNSLILSQAWVAWAEWEEWVDSVEWTLHFFSNSWEDKDLEPLLNLRTRGPTEKNTPNSLNRSKRWASPTRKLFLKSWVSATET